MSGIAYMGKIYPSGGGSGNGGHVIVDSTGTEVEQRSKLQFGNANVTDDETNDVTKVDIQNIEPITQEAYNQLTQAEKNAHPWFITNATSFGGVYLFQTVALMEAAVQAGTVPAGAVMMTGVDTPYVPAAEDVVYDNTESGLDATDLQGAVDEVNSNLIVISETIVTNQVTIFKYGKIRLLEVKSLSLSKTDVIQLGSDNHPAFFVTEFVKDSDNVDVRVSIRLNGELYFANSQGSPIAGNFVVAVLCYVVN